MRIHNRIPGINNKWIRNISPEISYLKDKEIIERKKKYDDFKLLLEKNKSIKGKDRKEKRLSYEEIEKIVGISKATFYRMKEKIEIKGITYWKALEKQSTKPKNFRKSEISIETKDIILEIRLDNPTYGKDKIKTILQRDFNIKLSGETINKSNPDAEHTGYYNLD